MSIHPYASHYFCRVILTLFTRIDPFLAGWYQCVEIVGAIVVARRRVVLVRSILLLAAAVHHIMAALDVCQFTTVDRRCAHALPQHIVRVHAVHKSARVRRQL